MHSSKMRTACSSSHLLGGGGCLPQCVVGYHPGCVSGDPLGVGLETLPQWLWVWRPAMHAGIHTPLSPCGQTDRCKNIIFANFVCGRYLWLLQSVYYPGFVFYCMISAIICNTRSYFIAVNGTKSQSSKGKILDQS